MNNVHHCQTLHNNMSPDNVLLHFLPIFPNTIYIGIYNWAMAESYKDLMELLYNRENEEAKSKTMQNRW
jgi:hypothetical protein